MYTPLSVGHECSFKLEKRGNTKIQILIILGDTLTKKYLII